MTSPQPIYIHGKGQSRHHLLLDVQFNYTHGLIVGTVTSSKWPMQRQKVFVKLVWKSTCFSMTYNYLNLMNRVPETLSEEVLKKMYAPPKPDVPIASPSILGEYDYFLFGIAFNFLSDYRCSHSLRKFPCSMEDVLGSYR